MSLQTSVETWPQLMRRLATIVTAIAAAAAVLLAGISAVLLGMS
ncbi:MAG TPA: hypothetical protein VH678_29620 [Xanthobacteraceae bacterium]|jgi:hypothetical protein